MRNQIMDRSILEKQKPAVTLKGFKHLGDGATRVVLEVGSNLKGKTEAFNKAVTGFFDGKMQALSGSFRSLSSTKFRTVVEGIVTPTAEVVMQNRADSYGLTAVSSDCNLYMDAESNMWALRKSQSGDLLIKTTGLEDDLSVSKFMQSHCSNVQNGTAFMQALSSSNAIAQSVEGGSFISYLSQSGELKAGYVVATVINNEVPQFLVLSADEDEEEAIDADQINDTFDTDTFPESETTEEEDVQQSMSAARGVVNIAELLAYYKKEYGRHPEFYKQFADRIKQHAFA